MIRPIRRRQAKVEIEVNRKGGQIEIKVREKKERKRSRVEQFCYPPLHFPHLFFAQ